MDKAILRATTRYIWDSCSGLWVWGREILARSAAGLPRLHADICGAAICEDCSIDGACSICAEEELCESCGCEASDLFYCDGCGRWVCWDCYSEDGGRCEECLSSPRPVG
jgi:hypothetical protein